MTRARIHDIITVAADMGVMLPGMITGKSKLPHIVRARRACYLLARQQGYRFTTIGRAMSRDHSTAVHGYHKAKAVYAADEQFASFVDRVRARALDLAPKANPERIYIGRVIPKKFVQPESSAKLTPAKPAAPEELDDIELLSRAVAAHYSGASA